MAASYENKVKPNLHFISIAISDYKEDSLNLKYPVSDVKAVEDKIKNKNKELYQNIYSYNLHNSDVTKENLDNLFSNLSDKITIDDAVIIYFAGHGTTSSKDGLYYFYSHDLKNTSYDTLTKKAISVNDIKYQLSKIKALKSLVLFDTCNSGGVIDNIIIRDRLSNDNKRNFIVASSSKQYALEGYKDHGVFSYGVLDAYKNGYPKRGTKLSTLNLANHLLSEVPYITNKFFHYEQTPLYLQGVSFDIGEK